MRRRVWSYEHPTQPFEPIARYFSFYASPFECWVDEERVQAQVGHPPVQAWCGTRGRSASGTAVGPPACWLPPASLLLPPPPPLHCWHLKLEPLQLMTPAAAAATAIVAALPPLPLQKGSFYGGWVTADVEGPFKGGPGTAGW
jgi:hypothetical protein